MIPYNESDKKYAEDGKNSQSACRYYENDLENGKKYGKIYNWYAVNDERGLAPEGYDISTINEWKILVQYLGEDIAWGQNEIKRRLRSLYC